MKQKSIFLFLIVAVQYCTAQSIDTIALRILQKSHDKLAALETISYQMTFLDSMIQENHLIVKRIPLHGTIKKNKYWHLNLDNKAEWLIRDDTIYKKNLLKPSATTFSTTTNNHEVQCFSIHNILGSNRPELTNDITSLKFVQSDALGDAYVIDEVRDRTPVEPTSIKNLTYFNRYWINKKSLFCFRRMMYSKSIEDGYETINIYDFSAALKSTPASFNSDHFFKIVPKGEKTLADIYSSTMLNTIAPNFAISHLNTGQSITLNHFKGKVVLLDFWYLSCPPCRTSIPQIQKLHEKFLNQDVAIIGLNVTDIERAPILKFLNDNKITFPQYYKTGSLATDYKLQAYPTTLIIGKDGKIKHIEVGEGNNTIANLEQAINKELNHK